MNSEEAIVSFVVNGLSNYLSGRCKDNETASYPNEKKNERINKAKPSIVWSWSWSVACLRPAENLHLPDNYDDDKDFKRD